MGRGRCKSLPHLGAAVDTAGSIRACVDLPGPVHRASLRFVSDFFSPLSCPNEVVMSADEARIRRELASRATFQRPKCPVFGLRRSAERTGSGRLRSRMSQKRGRRLWPAVTCPLSSANHGLVVQSWTLEWSHRDDGIRHPTGSRLSRSSQIFQLIKERRLYASGSYVQ